MGSKLDQMRNRLQVGTLSENERQELFKKMQKAGGQVVNLDDTKLNSKGADGHNKKSTSQAAKNQSSATTIMTENPFEAPPKNSSSGKTKVKSKAENNTNSKTTQIASVTISPWILFFARLSCFFSGIFNFTAKRFKKKFIHLILNRYYNAQVAIYQGLIPIFEGEYKDIFREHLFENGMIQDYEFAYHMFHMVDLPVFSKLQVKLFEFVEGAESEIIQLYKPLYHYYKYSIPMKIAVLAVVQRFEKIYSKEIKGNAKKIESIIRTDWMDLYYSLEHLVQYYWLLKKKETASDISFDVFLGLDDSNYSAMGSIAEEWKRKKIVEQIEEETGDDSEDIESEEESTIGHEFPNDNIALGTHFFQVHVDFLSYYKSFRTGHDLRTYFRVDDKVLYTYILADFFDSEFSFLWNSDFVIYYTITDGTLGRYDVKKDLININTKFNQFYELVNDYLRVVRTVSGIIRDAKKTNQYVLAQEKTKELARNSYSVRRAIALSMIELKNVVHKIVASENTDDTLIGNWDEVIQMNNRTQGHKVVNGMSVREAMKLLLSATESFIWLLENSDLSGMNPQLPHTPEALTHGLIDLENEPHLDISK